MLFLRHKKWGGRDLNEDITVVLINIILFAQSYYSIWFDYDSFLLNDNKLLVFHSFDDVQNYCMHKYNKKANVWTLNFDETTISDCSLFLDKWNVVGDIAKTLNCDFVGNKDSCTNLYSKFVYGANLPTMNNTDKKYIPSFDKEELHQIANVTNDMTRVLKLALEIDAPQ